MCVFVYSGIPTLKRSEIEAACEDFSNVIGSCPIGKLFKGTLSSGVEIAVASIDTTCANDWKEITEIQFRKKVCYISYTFYMCYKKKIFLCFSCL